MKPLNITALLFAAFFTFGCATSETAPTTEEAPTVGDSAESETEPRAKTAYDGATGSGLLMERYKSGNIGGYREQAE